MGLMEGVLGGLGGKVVDVVDQLVTDQDLARKLNVELQSAIFQSQAEIARSAADVIAAEANGQSWLQRNWRPMLMVWFAFLIGAYWFGFVPTNMPVEIVGKLFDLVTLGVGGYVVGRSGEKIATTVADAWRTK